MYNGVSCRPGPGHNSTIVASRADPLETGDELLVECVGMFEVLSSPYDLSISTSCRVPPQMQLSLWSEATAGALRDGR